MFEQNISSFDFFNIFYIYIQRLQERKIFIKNCISRYKTLINILIIFLDIRYKAHIFNKKTNK